MAQIKIYGCKRHLRTQRTPISDAIHEAVVSTLRYGPDKRFHLFFPLEPEDFLVPLEKGPRYTIIEIALMRGREAETKKRLIRTIFRNLAERCGLEPGEVEIHIIESPRHHWGLRGQNGDEIAMAYKVEMESGVSG